MTRRGGSDLYMTRVENPNRGPGYVGRTLFRRELTSFLDEVPERGRNSFERAVTFELYGADVGLAGEVSRHASRFLALGGCEKCRGRSQPNDGCFFSSLARDAYQSRGPSGGHDPPQ